VLQPKKVTLRLPPLHPRQYDFVMDQHRFVVAACGTKTGKTFGLSEWLINRAFAHKGSLNWWTAPVYKQAKIAFKLIGNLLPKHFYRKSKTDLTYELLDSLGNVRSIIEFRSADNPDSLRGEAVRSAVVDEAGYWNRDSFESLLTTLTRTQGWCRIISTPKGRNWFYEEWSKGWYPDQQAKFPWYKSFQLPTACNPHVPRESIEQARLMLPEDVFRQEYEAEFLDESAGVFKNITNCQVAQWLDDPIEGCFYVVGIDWAKKEDYTVFVVADLLSKEIVHIERHNTLDWNVNISKAIACARRWNQAAVMMDSTGVGDVPFDMMRAVYPYVEGYSIFNNEPKVQLIQAMQFALERSEIKLPYPKAHNNAATLDHEMRMYGYEMSATGKFLFSAPEGYHDDCVIAAALANWKLREQPTVYRATKRRGV
jgi:hypothetical protein